MIRYKNCGLFKGLVKQQKKSSTNESYLRIRNKHELQQVKCKVVIEQAHKDFEDQLSKSTRTNNKTFFSNTPKEESL